MFNWRKSKPDELAEAKARYEALRDERQKKELANAINYETSRLEHLQALGKPYYEPLAVVPQREQTVRIPVPVYEHDDKTGYPWKQTMHFEQVAFEQDPMFGWPTNPLYPFADYDWTAVMVDGFPRELRPDSASSMRVQVQFDAARFQSRIWYERLPQLAGVIGHLVNYTVGSGLGIEVVSEDDETLAKDIHEYLDGLCVANKLYKHLPEIVLGLLRDGESAIRIVPQPEYPILRQIDPSWIRGRHGEIIGPYSYGILTNWPDDFETPLLFTIWKPDNKIEDIAPTQFKLAKLGTIGANVKRGIPLSYKIRKQLTQLERLIECMAVGEAARQAIPYVRSFEIADKTAVQGAISSSCPPPWASSGADYGHGHHQVEPGEIPLINKGQKYNEPPEGHADSGTETYRVLCAAIANACQVPVWFCTGGMDDETDYNSAFIAEAPVVKTITRLQNIVTDHLKEVFEAAINMGIAQGRFPVTALETCDICLKLPVPIAHDKEAEVKAQMELLNTGIMSPQTVAQKNDLDWDHERELTKAAEATGWVNVPAQQMLSERPTGEEGEKAAQKE